MNYYRLAILGLMVYCPLVYSTVTFSPMGKTYRSAQLTPRGNDHPIVVMTGQQILFEDASIPVEFYAGKVVMMGYRPHWDEDVCRYENEYNASCVIITSTNPYTPGSNLNKGLNRCTYTCAFEMLYTEFQQFAEEDYKNYMIETLGQGVVTVDLDGNDGNPWKEMAYSALFMLNVSLSGLVCVVMIVGNIINLVMLRLRNKTHMRMWTMICVLLLLSGIVGNIGFVDFNCFLQVLPYRMCNIFSAIRPAFVFCAINLLSYTFIDAVKMHVGGPKILPSKFWVCCVISFGYLAFTITNATTITFVKEYASVIANLVIWLAGELLYQTYTAILNLIISIKTIKRLNESKVQAAKMSVKRAQIKRTTTMLIIISIDTLIYVVFVGLVNESVNYPWFLGGTWIVYNQLLNVISLIVTYSMFMNIRKNMDKKKTSSKTTDSNQSTKMSKRTSSVLDLNAVTQETDSKE